LKRIATIWELWWHCGKKTTNKKQNSNETSTGTSILTISRLK
jgi:hypothetical protein